MMRALVLACAAALGLASTAGAVSNSASGAPMDPHNLIADDIEAEAYAAYGRLAQQHAFKGPEIVIIDYRLPSSAKRLYIANLITGAVEATYVAHGRGSDPGHTRVAQRFSDAISTGMSSVGAYRGLNRYQSGEHGPALRLAGLDATNASAYRRLIVFHTAGYFNPAAGRYGRSCGCFVVTTDQMKRVYDVIADGGFLYAGPARLHDRSASTARDCSKECGSGCTPQPLLVKNETPEAPVAVAAVVPPPPEPAPQPPPVVLAAAAPAPEKPMAVAAAASPAPVFDAPLPQPKPSLAAEPAPVVMAAAVTDDVPLPLAKPALDVAPPPVAIAEADTSHVPLPQAKPVLSDTPPDAAAIAAVIDAPRPAYGRPAIMDDAQWETASVADAALDVPDVAPGELPIPSPKPVTLQRVADAGPP